MTSIANGYRAHARTVYAAQVLRRDIRLVLKHAHTLPLIFGSYTWLTRDRYRVNRPYSELNLRLYPLEALRIGVQLILSLPFATVLLLCILLSLASYSLHERTGISYLSAPFDLLVRCMPSLLKRHILRISSPGDRPVVPEGDVSLEPFVEPSPPHAGSNTAAGHSALSTSLRDVRSVLYPGRTFIAESVCADSAANVTQEVFFYINGVAEQGAMVRATTALLHRMTGRICNAFVNPSDGVFLDLLECVLGRTFDTAAQPAADLLPHIVRHLSLGRRVVLLAHSQGAIIVSNVVRELVRLCTRAQAAETLPGERAAVHEAQHRAAFVPHGLRNVEVFTFGGAADELDGRREGLFAEHFAAENDFVARIGALTFSGQLSDERAECAAAQQMRIAERRQARSAVTTGEWNGEVFMLPSHALGQGHLMKEHLLPALTGGLFGTESTFWAKYCNPNSEKFVSVKRHLVE